jgi:hypothetical protein
MERNLSLTVICWKLERSDGPEVLEMKACAVSNTDSDGDGDAMEV